MVAKSRVTFALVGALAAFGIASAPAGPATEGHTFATTELSVFSDHLPPGVSVHVVTVFTADGEDYGYYLGGSERIVPANGKLTVHIDLTDIKNGEAYESGTIHGWFTTDYLTPLTRTDGQPAEFTVYVP